MKNVFEGVDTSPIDNLFSTLVKSVAIFFLAPCVVAFFIAYVLKLSRRATAFLIVLFFLVGFFIWLLNLDQIENWFL